MTTLTEFHLFSRLPLELQDKIWNAAIRPKVPGFHALFFEQHHPGIDTYCESSGVIYAHNDDVTRRFWGKNRAYDWEVKAVIQAPRPSTDIIEEGVLGCPAYDHWRQDSNKSFYLEDGGLWTACTRSRYTMTLYHQRLVRVPPSTVRLRRAPGAIHSATSASSSSSVHTVTRRPNNSETRITAVTGNFPVKSGGGSGLGRMLFHIECDDVVCVQSNWGQLKAQSGDDVKLYVDSICRSLKGVKNIAFEWEPWMDSDLGRCSPYTPVLNRTGLDYWKSPHAHTAESPIAHFINVAQRWQDQYSYPFYEEGERIFWFLDRSIRRDPQWKAAIDSKVDENYLDKERISFQGRGIKLTEVRYGDEGWIAPSLDPLHTCHIPTIPGVYINTDPLEGPTPSCGAHCGIRGYAVRISGRSRPTGQPTLPSDIFEILQTGTMRVLAVEYGNL